MDFCNLKSLILFDDVVVFNRVVVGFTLVDKLLCVELVGAAAAAPHIVRVNARQNIRKPNRLLY